MALFFRPHWSCSAPPMGAVDLAYHRSMGGAPLPVGFLVRFRGVPPTLETLRARVCARAPFLPVLHHRVVGGHRPAVARVEIVAENHVHGAELFDDVDGSAAGRMMLTRPFPDDGRPPWDVWLIRGPQDSYTLCYRGDHILQDGTGAAHITRALLSDSQAAGPAGRPPTWPTPRGLAGALGDMFSTLRRPGAGLPDAFAARPSGSEAVCVVDTPLGRLRSVARAHGGTVNDVYLAALAHALRVWHLKETGAVPPPLPVVVPMSVRGPYDDFAPGNRMIMTRLQLPCDEESPARALARIIARTGTLRRTRQRDATRLLVAAGPRGAGAAVGVRLVNGRRVIGAVSGMDFGGPLTHAGNLAFSASMFTGLAAGMLCYTSLTGYCGTARLTIVHDLALRNAGMLAESWPAALAELDGAEPVGP